MDFQNAALYQPQQSVEILYSDVVLVAAFLRIIDLPDLLAHPSPRMFLEEAGAGDAFRASQERQRTMDDERRHQRPDFEIVVGKPGLGDAGLRPVYAVGMGECHAALRRRVFRVLGCRFLHHFARRLVFPQTAEGSMPQMGIRRPAAELDFRDELRPHEDDVAAFRRRETFGKGRPVLLKRFQGTVKLLGDRGAVACADTARVGEVALVVVVPHDQ